TGTLRRGEGGLARLYASLGTAWSRGVPVDWTTLYTGRGARRADLPTYAFQRGSYWLSAAPAQPDPAPATAADETEARFWQAVEAEDLEALAGTLDLAERRALGELLPGLAAWRRRSRERATLDSWRYQVTWTPVPVPATPTPLGTWLIVTSEQTAGPVTAALAAHAETVTLEIDPTRAAVAGTREALAARLADTVAALPRLDGVLALLGPHEEEGGAAATALVLAQALADAQVTAPLWCATRGAVAAGRADRAPVPAQAAVWGLGRVLALEHPATWGGLVDLPDPLDERATARLTHVLAGDLGDEDQVALRTSGVLARRLTRAPLGDGEPVRRWQPRGTVLVTGGTGG
ncbi:polyketide synthase, partial [Streptomyces sp. NPDC000987]